MSGISKISNTPISRSRELLTEMRLQRIDMDKVKDMVQALNKKMNTASPYAADRKTIDHDKIHKNPKEGEWRKVSSDNGRDTLVREDNLKKLNIL